MLQRPVGTLEAMDVFIGRTVAVLLGFGLAVAAGATVKELSVEPVPPVVVRACSTDAFLEIQQGLARLAPARNEQVLAELKGLGGHAWAGVYRTRGGWPTELRIAPDAGFTVYEDSCCGNCQGWLALGRVRSVKGAELKLEVELGYDVPGESEFGGAWYSLQPTLHLVRWGELVFAVPPWRMEL